MHSLLKRQIRRYFGEDEPSGACSPFLEAVNAAYHQADDDRLMLERAMDLTSDELMKKNTEISEQLEERIRMVAELQMAKDKAVEATNLKDKFVTLVAHDLKSPFNSILGHLKLIQADTSVKMAPKHKEWLNNAVQSSEMLVNMIDGLLNISRLQTGKLVPKKRFFDVSLISASVISNQSLLAKEKGIKLIDNIASGTRVYADMALYLEVIQNLVSNSIKFCGKGDTVIISGSGSNMEAVTVTDTGPGIAPDIMPNLFRHEIKTSTIGSAGEHGTGLGLPYASDIMKAHDGELKVTSSPGKGCEFTAELPHVNPRVLMVEDDMAQRRLIAEMLHTIDVEVTEADDGEAALAAIERHVPHMVLTDLKMKRLDGFGLLERIRQNESLKTLPVIVITSDTSIKTREEAFRCGASDFTTKPVKKADLIPRVKRHFM